MRENNNYVTFPQGMVGECDLVAIEADRFAE